VNFALSDWFSHGLASVEEYRKHKRPSVFPPDQLLLNLITDLIKVSAPQHDVGGTDGLRDALDQLISIERRLRNSAVRKGLKRSRWVRLSPAIPQSEGCGLPPQCHICHQFCYLSFVRCRCSPSRIACLHHARQVPLLRLPDSMVWSPIRFFMCRYAIVAGLRLLRFIASIYLSSVTCVIHWRANICPHNRHPSLPFTYCK
jgi:hypothetical protein